MTVERNQTGWVFWFLWVLMSTVGWVLGFIIGFVLAYVPGDLIGNDALADILANFTFGAGLGIGVGILQWLILREYVSRAGWWVLASTAGLTVAFGYSEGLGSFATVLDWTVFVVLGGAVTGIVQWLALRRQVSRAGWWVLASTVGWGLSMAVVEALSVVGVESFTGSPVGGPVLGAVTGGALVWLLRQPVPET